MKRDCPYLPYDISAVRHCCLLALLIISHLATHAQTEFAHWNKAQLVLDNGIVRREIALPQDSGHYGTSLYRTTDTANGFFNADSPDFSFKLNQQSYAGSGHWLLLGIERCHDSLQGAGATVQLQSADKKLQVYINYLLYPGLPVIRKSLRIQNLGQDTVALEAVNVEQLSLTKYFPNTYSWVFSDYGRRRSLGAYESNKQDALIILHNPSWQQGIVMGNEAPGVMKRTSVFWEAPEICIGLTGTQSHFPFRKWLAPGAVFTTPQVFTMLYSRQKDPSLISNTALPDFIRRHMGIRLSAFPDKPSFVYNTWRPFKSAINDTLIKALAIAAAKAGIKEFVIDDGWQDKLGDWGIDTKKFPHGLKPVFDHIKSLGMKAGLWVSIGTAAPDSKVYQQHPSWFVADKNGHPISLIIDDKDKYTACLGTGWYSYIKTVLQNLVNDYGLEYLKLDFSVVTSPYRYDHTESGCYAQGHCGHKDHSESLYTNYALMWQLFDELHKATPSLFIDCTFETMGGLQLIDYALLQHAEGDWLSNFYETDEAGDLRVRNMAWWRSPAMPATALVIGNLNMEDKGGEAHFMSLAGALPIMLGDPRRLNSLQQKTYARYAAWLQQMGQRYDVMSYRQDLAGFAEPAEGQWDGYQRINTQLRNGGMVAVFRQGATESKRFVTVNYLSPQASYNIINAGTGKVIGPAMSGAQLQAIGFPVTIEQRYGGAMFEIAKKP